MIDFVEGTVCYIDTEYVVVEAGGIGYRLFCPNPYSFVKDEGTKRRFFTHHHVREDAIHLYGFASRDDRDMYRRLLDVTGIGPKGALAILAAASPEQIVLAIQQENVNYLTKFPGIGKKTAQRIIIDLKDKLKGFTPSMLTVEVASTSQEVASIGSFQEALEALEALGYSDNELQTIKAMLRDKSHAGSSVEQLVKLGLAQLMRG